MAPFVAAAPRLSSTSPGLRGYDLPRSARPPANLVFLLDVSGSMNSPDKLPLVKTALAGLAGELSPRDKVSIVVYAGAAGLVLEPTNDSAAGLPFDAARDFTFVSGLWQLPNLLVISKDLPANNVPELLALLKLDAELGGTLGAEPEADQAAAVAGHEGDRFGRDPAGRGCQVEVAAAQRIAGKHHQPAFGKMLGKFAHANRPAACAT